MRFWPIAMGMGMAAGAVAAMMLPKQSTARKMVDQAASKVESAVNQAANKMLDEMTS